MKQRVWRHISYEVPVDVLKDKEALRMWAEKALAMAIQKKRQGKYGACSQVLLSPVVFHCRWD